MTTDTVFSLLSTTKALTGTVLMKLVEERKVRLDDPVKEYVPEIADIMVVEGVDPNGQPRLRKPKMDITVNMLMLHTAGFGYEFFSLEDRKYREAKDVPSIMTSSFDSVKSVLLFEPGERWNYGANIDWVGKVVETVYGMRLGEAMKRKVFTILICRILVLHSRHQ